MRYRAAVLSVAMTCLAAPCAVADDVPNLNVEKSCRRDVQAYSGGNIAAACVSDEQRARQTLTGQWSSFSADSKSSCLKLITDVAGTESYIELLTCLQMAKQSSTLPKN